MDGLNYKRTDKLTLAKAQKCFQSSIVLKQFDKLGIPMDPDRNELGNPHGNADVLQVLHHLKLPFPVIIARCDYNHVC